MRRRSPCFGNVSDGPWTLSKARHGLTELHVFPVMPVAAAVEFGRVWMPKADMPLTIYDQNKGREGFYKTIQID